MATILAVINKTTPYFEKHGVESPRLTIELLLAHVLQTKRLQLYLDFEREVDEARLSRLRELVKRRADGEPLHYVTGAAEFFGLMFAVDRRVLIPRPETELLVEAVISRAPRSIVDVGTGSGCVAVALARKLPGAAITAIDASAAALTVAQTNAATHGVENSIRFLAGNLLSDLPDGFVAESIVSNPPYIAEGELATLPREVKDFEPAQALAGGVDGLEVIRRLISTARRFLSPRGFVALEIGAGQCAAVRQLFADNQFAVTEVLKDLQGHERVVIATPRE